MKLNFKSITAKAVSATVGAAAGIYVASGLTMTIMSASSIPGAISSTTTVINGKTVFLSVVKAGLFSKILSGLLVGVIVGGATYYVYKSNEDRIKSFLEDLKNKSKEVQEEFKSKVTELQSK